MLVRVTKGLTSAFRNALLETLKQTFSPYSMSEIEALKIMNLNSQFTHQELDSQFKKFYDGNSKKNSGSPYIQTKVKNAYDYLARKVK
jgi:hypothetical protein